MGGVGYALGSGRSINVMNPASYSRIDSLTFLFDMGVDFTIFNRTQGDTRFSDNGGGLEYVTMQFPISKRIGASFGLLPFSSVGYAFGSEINNGSYTQQGSGGINQLYVGAAYNIVNGLSAGFNFSYLFGTNNNEVYINPDGGYSALFRQELQVRDFRVQFGLQYEQKIAADRYIGVGLVFAPGKDLLGSGRVIKYDVSSNEKPDTLQDISLRRNFSLPTTWGVGINYRHSGKLLVEADFTYQPWTKAKFAEMSDFPTTVYADRWKVALGTQFRPRERGSYFQAMTYRLGAFYNRDYITIGGNHVRDYGLACGFGFPTYSTKSIINLGFEYRLKASGSPGGYGQGKLFQHHSRHQLQRDVVPQAQDRLMPRGVDEDIAVCGRSGRSCLLMAMTACGGDDHREYTANVDPELVATMTTTDVSTLISDSGITRYRVVTPLWLVYDEAREKPLALPLRGCIWSGSTISSTARLPSTATRPHISRSNSSGGSTGM